MAKQKYYVVWAGKQPGIYDNWPEAEGQVKGFAGARYKAFPTRAEAEAAYGADAPRRRSGGKQGAASDQPKSPAASGEFDIDIYCDGACDPNPGPAGTGLALYRGGQLAELWYGFYTPSGTNNTAELLGLQQALRFAREAIAAGQTAAIHCDSRYAIDCVTQWAFGWKARGWKRKDGEVKNLEIIQAAHELYLELADSVKIFHVRGHAGIEGNELADRMSMYAIAQQETGLQRFSAATPVAAVLAMRAG